MVEEEDNIKTKKYAVLNIRLSKDVCTKLDYIIKQKHTTKTALVEALITKYYIKAKKEEKI